METEQSDTPPDYLSKLSFEMLVRILRYLPVQSLLRLESLSRHLQKAVDLHLQLVKSLDFTSDKWYGYMPEAIDDEALNLLLRRCTELEYIYGLHPNNLLLRKEDNDSNKCISISGIINALQLCHRLIGVEISDIHLLEAILTELPNIEILGHFHNRNGCFPVNESSQLTLPSTSKLTCLHLYGILLPELPALNGLDELHLQFVKFSNPQPFLQFQSQWLLSFMMHNCIGPTNPLHYVPLLTALGNATHLRRLDLVRVPFLGGLLQHVVEDVWKKGGFSGVEKVRISTCKNCFETDIGYLLLASEYWLEELSLQPSLTKDSFFWALKLAKVNFNMFETLELGYVHPSITSGEWTNARLVEHGLTDYAEPPGLVSDLGMSLVQVVFNSVISLTIHNCPHLLNPLLWCVEQKKWDWLKSLHLDRCHSIQLNEFCQWLTDLPVIHDVRLEHMFCAPPKGCSMVGLSAGTGLGVSSALVAPIGQTEISPNAADDHEVNVNMDINETAEKDKTASLRSKPDSADNQSFNEKACQSANHQGGSSPCKSSSSYSQSAKECHSTASDAVCFPNELNASGSRNYKYDFPGPSNTEDGYSKNVGNGKSDVSCATESVSANDISRLNKDLKQCQRRPPPTTTTTTTGVKSPPRSVVSSSSVSSSVSSSLSTSPLTVSSGLKPSSTLENSSPSVSTCSVSSTIASSSNSLPSTVSSTSPKSSSVPSQSCSSLRSSQQYETLKDTELSEQLSPLPKRKRQIPSSETLSGPEKSSGSHKIQTEPIKDIQGDATQGSSEQTGTQNRCPTLEENFGLTCKAYVQECTYHDHSGQMRIRAVRTQSGQSSVIIPNSGPVYCLNQETDVQPLRRTQPKNDGGQSEKRSDLEVESDLTNGQPEMESNFTAVSDLKNGQPEMTSNPVIGHNLTTAKTDIQPSRVSPPGNSTLDTQQSETGSSPHKELDLRNDELTNWTNKPVETDVQSKTLSENSTLDTGQVEIDSKIEHIQKTFDSEVGSNVINEQSEVRHDPQREREGCSLKSCKRKISNDEYGENDDSGCLCNHTNSSYTNKKSSAKKLKINSVDGTVNKHLDVVDSRSNISGVTEATISRKSPNQSELLNHNQVKPTSSNARQNVLVKSSNAKDLMPLCMENSDNKLPKKRKVSTRNQSTSTSDPVAEDDPVQVMVITSKTLEGLTLDSCGISHLHLMDCPQLSTLSGYDLKILQEVKMKNCPNLGHIDFSQVPFLTNTALLEPVIWLPPTRSRFVKLSPLHMKSKSALESWLFSIDHCKYQLMYGIESKSSAGSIEGSVYMTNWMDITTWLNNYYLSTLTYAHSDDAKGRKRSRRSMEPRNIFVTRCSVGGSKFKLSTDVPWLRTLSNDNRCQMEFGKPIPEVYPAERSDIVAILAKRCIAPLTHDMAEMRSMKAIIRKCVLCIYIQVSDIQKKENNQ